MIKPPTPQDLKHCPIAERLLDLARGVGPECECRLPPADALRGAHMQNPDFPVICF
jgi:hypothetical protein